MVYGIWLYLICLIDHHAHFLETFAARFFDADLLLRPFFAARGTLALVARFL